MFVYNFIFKNISIDKEQYFFYGWLLAFILFISLFFTEVELEFFIRAVCFIGSVFTLMSFLLYLNRSLVKLDLLYWAELLFGVLLIIALLAVFFLIFGIFLFLFFKPEVLLLRILVPFVNVAVLSFFLTFIFFFRRFILFESMTLHCLFKKILPFFFFFNLVLSIHYLFYFYFPVKYVILAIFFELLSCKLIVKFFYTTWEPLINASSKFSLFLRLTTLTPWLVLIECLSIDPKSFVLYFSIFIPTLFNSLFVLIYESFTLKSSSSPVINSFGEVAKKKKGSKVSEAAKIASEAVKSSTTVSENIQSPAKSETTPGSVVKMTDLVLPKIDQHALSREVLNTQAIFEKWDSAILGKYDATEHPLKMLFRFAITYNKRAYDLLGSILNIEQTLGFSKTFSTGLEVAHCIKASNMYKDVADLGICQTSSLVKSEQVYFADHGVSMAKIDRFILTEKKPIIFEDDFGYILAVDGQFFAFSDKANKAIAQIYAMPELLIRTRMEGVGSACSRICISDIFCIDKKTKDIYLIFEAKSAKLDSGLEATQQRLIENNFGARAHIFIASDNILYIKEAVVGTYSKEAFPASVDFSTAYQQISDGHLFVNNMSRHEKTRLIAKIALNRIDELLAAAESKRYQLELDKKLAAYKKKYEE